MKKSYLNILVTSGNNGEWLVVARIPAVELVLASFRSHKKAKKSANKIIKALGKTVKYGTKVPYHPLGTLINSQDHGQKD
jgi:hypothetical protein